MNRIHGLDALRGYAMLLGVFFHSALAYTDTKVSYWGAHNNSTNELFDIFIWISHQFRMPVFFIISGIFSYMMINRKGARSFLTHRLKRIVLPFLAGLLFFSQLNTIAWTVDSFQLKNLLTLAHWKLTIPGHLWFLYYLSFFCPLLVLIAPSLKKLSKYKAKTHSILYNYFSPLIFAIPTATILLFMNRWISINSPINFKIEWPTFIYYAIFFFFGAIIQATEFNLSYFKKVRWSYPFIAFCLVPIVLQLFTYEFTGQNLYLLKTVVAFSTALFSWLMVYSCISIFIRYFNRYHPVQKYISESSYWVYLLHVPVIVFIQNWQIPFHYAPFPKYIFTLILTLCITNFSYRLFVKNSFIGQFLGGR